MTVHTLGPLWLGLIAIVVLVLAHPVHVWRRVRAHPVGHLAAAATVVLATLGSLAWVLSANANDPASEHFGLEGSPFPKIFGELILWPLQAIGAYPSRNEGAPVIVYAMAVTVFIWVTVIAARQLRGRVLAAVLLLVVLSFAVPFALTLATYAQIGLAWQGRYGLPFSAGYFLILGLALDQAPGPPRVRSFPLGVAAALLAAELAFSLHGVVQRALEFDLWRDNPHWYYPGMAVLVLAVVAGTTSWFAAVVQLRAGWTRLRRRDPRSRRPWPPATTNRFGPIRDRAPGPVLRSSASSSSTWSTASSRRRPHAGACWWSTTPGPVTPSNPGSRPSATTGSATSATRTTSAARIVVELLRRGIFAIADKPMAVTLAQLALIEETLAGRNLLTLLLEKRFYPVTLALRSVIDSGQLGDIVSITATGPHKLVPSRRPAWMFEPSTYGGILADLTVHDIDLALWLTGYTSGTISGWISSTPAAGTTNFPALGRAILACDGGPEFAIEVDWIQPEASPRHGDYAMRISGTKGRADVLFAENRLLVETATRPRREIDLPVGASPASFVFDHLARGETLQIAANEALRATRIAILAQESAANGGKPMRWS